MPWKNRFHFGIILFPRVKVITGSLNMVLQDLLFLPSLGRMPQNHRLLLCPCPSDIAYIISSFKDGLPLPVFYEISICPLRSLHVTSQWDLLCPQVIVDVSLLCVPETAASCLKMNPYKTHILLQ